MSRQIWVMMVCGVLIVLIGNGFRMTFGIFLRPVSFDLEIGRQVFGLVIAVQTLLSGVVQPMVGMLADRFGAARVIVIGAIFYAAGLWLASLAAGTFDLYVSVGFLVGVGLSGTTQVVVLGAIGKIVPNEKRGTVFGAVIASGSLGMFLFVPGMQGMLDTVGWRETFVVMALCIAVLPVLAVGMRADPAAGAGSSKQTLGDAIGEARRHRGYILLTCGFFVCGFHVTFIGTHFPAYLADKEVSSTAAAYAMGIIGVFNIIGAYAFGMAGDRFSKKNVLTMIYLLRAMLMTVLLLIPINDVTAVILGAALGVVWLATVPLTSGIVAQVFGTKYFSMLYGVVFMSHQIGGFTGAWLGGLIYDMTGSYDLMWVVAVLLGLVSAALHWPISERPLARLSERPA